MNKALLYYAPPSFYSQMAYLALVEKGVGFDEKIIIPGPPNFGTYQPDYMRLNPGGTVPTLVFEGVVYADSRKIVDLLLNLEHGNNLVPSDGDKQTQMQNWIECAYGLSERELAYGSGKLKFIGGHVNHKRLKELKKLRVQNPKMANVYDAKIADIEDFIGKSQNPSHVEKLSVRFDAELDRLNAALEHRDYVVGDTYTMADVCWTIVVARQNMLKRTQFDKRIHLARWFDAMKARPSFTQAGVMDRFRFSAMWKMISSLWKKP